MNRPEILHLIRHDLLRAVAQREAANSSTDGRLTLGGNEAPRRRPFGGA